MPQPMEDFLVELAQAGDPTILSRLPGYLSDHYAKTGNIVDERNRLMVAFKNKATSTALATKMLEIIEKSN